MTPPRSDAVARRRPSTSPASAVLEIAPADHVGDHLGVAADADGLATHTFACLAPGYRGWTLGRDPRGRARRRRRDGRPRSCCCPAPAPCSRPRGSRGTSGCAPATSAPGDLYPTAPDDPRLEPGFGGADALEAADETASTLAPLRPEQWELGLGRETVLSSLRPRRGRRPLVRRRLRPRRAHGQGRARPVPQVRLPAAHRRALGQAFGVCANEFGADGRVVALGYGCGAHSSVREIEGTGVPVTEIAIDEYGLELARPARRVDERTSTVEVPDRRAPSSMADGSEVVVDRRAATSRRSTTDARRRRGPTSTRTDVARGRRRGRSASARRSTSEDADEGYLAEPTTTTTTSTTDDLDDDEDDEDEDDDEDDEDEADEAADQIALELDDVEDIEPDETSDPAPRQRSGSAAAARRRRGDGARTTARGGRAGLRPGTPSPPARARRRRAGRAAAGTPRARPSTRPSR